MSNDRMTLEILLPSRVYADIADVERIVAETHDGSFGLLPHRLDCVAALSPGILIYATAAGEVCLAIDQGVLVKTGSHVRVAVRAVQAGDSLDALRDAVTSQFLALTEQEQGVRSAMLKLETGFMRAAGMRHE
jgi:F-type H+-transporting ATPase subunit epsilon